MSESKKTKRAKEAAPGWLLDNIAEASKNARKIYLLYIGFLAYCALTVVSTTDRQIVLDEPAKLPIIDLEVSLTGFFFLAPILAIFIFIYLQLYLNKLKGLKRDDRAKAVVRDSNRLYPWMLNFADELETGFVGSLQRVIVKFSLWWTLPAVLILIAVWYLKKHHPVYSYVLGAMPVVGTLIVLIFWWRYGSSPSPDEEKSVRRRVLNQLSLALPVLVFEILLFTSIIPNALNGRPTRFLGTWTNVDLSYQTLIDKKLKDYKTLYWVDLKGAHLEGANVEGAILSRADLEGASLLRANMEGAHLGGANLAGAQLEEAYLKTAQLHGAFLEGAQMRGATLSVANLDSANLAKAQLQGAKNLTVGQLAKEKTLYRTELDSVLLEQIERKYPHLLESRFKVTKEPEQITTK